MEKAKVKINIKELADDYFKIKVDIGKNTILGIKGLALALANTVIDFDLDEKEIFKAIIEDVERERKVKKNENN